MELQLIIGLVSLILSIAVLVAFFNISSNLRQIKDAILPAVKQYEKSDLQARRLNYYVNRSFNDEPHQLLKIKDLTAIIYAELLDPVIGVNERNAVYDKLKTSYGKVFDSAGLPFPPNIGQTIQE